MNFLGLFDVVEIIIALVMAFVISVTISIGRSVTCNNLADSNRYAIVSDGQYIDSVSQILLSKVSLFSIFQYDMLKVHVS